MNAGSRRPDIVNAGSRETRYSECRVQGDLIVGFSNTLTADTKQFFFFFCLFSFNKIGQPI
ncbi:unnamed protein product [Staurois parvus]|uniref:Uncharacterized protein n=1 Tax=Staurois parvus TaxID=386267 RepID=A0ABN9DLP8_9NEOB|nr:unnamed protein product [Staurois parvus]